MDDLLGLLRLCARFDFEWLHSECVTQLERVLVSRRASGYVAVNLVSVWRYCCGVKDPHVRRIAWHATAECLWHDYAAAKAKLVEVGVWESLSKEDMDVMFQHSCEKLKKRRNVVMLCPTTIA